MREEISEWEVDSIKPVSNQFKTTFYPLAIMEWPLCRTTSGDFKCREVKTGFCRKRWMQTGSSGTLIGWKSGQTTYFPLWDRMEGAWLWTLRRYDMNGRFPMQGGKNWILPKEINANRFFWDSHWLEILSNHLCPSMGPNGGSVAMDSRGIQYAWTLL